MWANKLQGHWSFFTGLSGKCMTLTAAGFSCMELILNCCYVQSTWSGIDWIFDKYHTPVYLSNKCYQWILTFGINWFACETDTHVWMIIWQLVSHFMVNAYLVKKVPSFVLDTQITRVINCPAFWQSCVVDVNAFRRLQTAGGFISCVFTLKCS